MVISGIETSVKAVPNRQIGLQKRVSFARERDVLVLGIRRKRERSLMRLIVTVLESRVHYGMLT